MERPVFAVLFLLTVFRTVTPDDICSWPDYLDVSVDYGDQLEELEVNSWETKIRIKNNDQRVNGEMKQNVWLTVLSNDTIELAYNVKQRDLESKTNKLRYTCVKQIDDSTFTLRVMRGKLDENNTFIATEPPKYKCVEFIRRSKFVLQWRDGPESEDIVYCSSGFAPIKPWPLIHLPVRNLPVWQSIQKEHGQMIPDLLKEYQSCPDLGGYHIRVFVQDGKSINRICKNNNPSPRLEFECVNGDGVRLIQEKPCTEYSALGMGSKLHCLATWEEGRYQFSVLVPLSNAGINSFHCLRINKDDPTKEPAVLFLDTICGRGDVVRSKVNNFQLELRKASMSSICDDTSDQCSVDKCESMNNSCLTTCNTCPANITLPIDDSIHGIWIFEKGGTERKINITEQSIELFGEGIFHAYTSGSSETDGCLQDAFASKESNALLKYLLGGVPKKEGCGPRVTTLRARKISNSVLLAQIPPPAPLRANTDISRPDHWCRNNFNDIGTFGQLFMPAYPFQAASGIFQNTSGYLTLINEENQEPGVCDMEDIVKNMALSGVFKGENETGYYRCEGNSKIEDAEKSWRLTFTCNEKISVDFEFSCLGRYEMDTNHYAVILKKSNKKPLGQIVLQSNYYCIIFPSKAITNSSVIFHNAGECDIVFRSLVEMDVIEPIMTLTVGESSGVMQSATAVTYIPIICWLYVIISRLVFQ